MAITALTVKEVFVNKIRGPYEAGFNEKEIAMDIEIDLSSANTYDSSTGISVATILTTYGMGQAQDMIECRLAPLMLYSAGARVYTTLFHATYDRVHRSARLLATTKTGASAGSGAEAGEREVANGTAINGATYLNGNTARFFLYARFKTAATPS